MVSTTKATQEVTPLDAHVEIQLCIKEEQERYVPKHRRAPVFLPANVPIPKKGEVIYLSQRSPWCVSLVIHQWRDPSYLRVEVWLEHMGVTRVNRPSGFSLTQ